MLGELAREKGTTPELRRFGLTLSRDHRVGDRSVLDIARREDLAVTRLEPDEEEQRMIARLRAATGPEFDQAFLEAMERSHERSIALLESVRASDDPELRRLAEKLSPILRQHHQIALNLQRMRGAAGG